MSGLHRKLTLATVAALATSALFSGATQAAVVPLGTSGWTASWASSFDPFLSIVVDGQGSDQVFIQKIAQFTTPPSPAGVIDPIQITFTQTAPNAVHNIVIEDEAITNQTGVAWTDFHMDITDSGNAAFNPAATLASGGPPPIGFSIAPFTTAAFGPTPSGPNTALDIAGGTVPNGATWFPGAGPGGGALWITANTQTTQPFTVFTLKERPTVPEPASMAALALGAAAMVRRVRKS